MKIRVGILTAPKIDYEQRANSFVLHGVRIGIGFHWDRYEEQEFEGELEITSNADGTQTAVNIIDIEDYLTSVISSEMSANSPIELLKAHTVIARSWLLRAIGNTDHVGYDVCADDHCQRYEGIRRRNQRAIDAVRATEGEVLTSDIKEADGTKKTVICDTRYHKCCGGRTELFDTCWDSTEPHPYLKSVEDPFCNTSDRQVLQQILNDYDLETMDFHDWTVQYTAEQLSGIIRQKSGIDFGQIIDLVPLKRGESGRICELEIIGTKQRMTIGKELTIRRWLSETHLYSSNFQIVKSSNPTFFRFVGHGWGHGVGLCQIGAAVMASEGYNYRQILDYYFPNTIIKK